MPYFTYILYSHRIKKYYVGHTQDLENRIIEHNKGEGKYTRIGIPWELISSFQFITKAEAAKFEIKIKKRGCKRFLEENLISSV